MNDRTKAEATHAVLRVGDGRGFVVAVRREHFPQPVIITAAHCLPLFPPAHSFSHLEERTYERLLGPLGGETTVWAECLFADPIADIAILGEPDSQALYDKCEEYARLVEAIKPLRIADAPEDGPALMLSLDQQWLPCRVKHYGGPTLTTSETKTVGGMSGSPIITEDGKAIGVVVIGSNSEVDGPHPRLMFCLPGWALPNRRPKMSTFKASMCL
jgi:hypothetical protein